MKFPTMWYAQSDQSFCESLAYSRSVQLLTEHRLQFLSLKGGCTGLSESKLVKVPHCWKSHALAQIVYALSLWQNFNWDLTSFDQFI